MTTTDPGSGIRLNEMVEAAHAATRAGRPDEAARGWERVLALAPNHPQALFFLGQHMLFRGNPHGACELFQRAATADPKQPVIKLNLAFACRALGDAKAEMAALDAALASEPYFYPALLSKGALFDRMGEKRQAARIYKDALTIMPPDDQLAPELKAPAARAREVVRENVLELDAFVEARLKKLRARHDGARLDRFDECKDVVTGAKKVYVHQPTLLLFPRLPAIQFFDRAEFPWFREIEAQTDAIREELLALLREKNRDFKPYVNYPAGLPLNQWTELNNSTRWSALFLWKDGERIDEHCKICPRTTAALGAVPLAVVPGFAPTAFFSALQPHTRIPAHTGVTNTRLTVHLPLILPGQCYFRVGNETREWRLGEAWAFDDTIEHEAWNDSDQLRVIMIFDVWNPLLSPAERDLVSALLTAAREYYGGLDADFSH